MSALSHSLHLIKELNCKRFPLYSQPPLQLGAAMCLSAGSSPRRRISANGFQKVPSEGRRLPLLPKLECRHGRWT